MKINWKVRLKNKSFWLTVIPALLIIIQLALSLFGIAIDLNFVQTVLLGIVNAAFVILTAMGLVTDHTTQGFSDSEVALDYEQPRSDNQDAEELMTLAQHYNDSNRSDLNTDEIDIEIDIENEV